MFFTCLFQASLKDSNDVYFTFLSRLCRIANTPPVKGNGHLKVGAEVDPNTAKSFQERAEDLRESRSGVPASRGFLGDPVGGRLF